MRTIHQGTRMKGVAIQILWEHAKDLNFGEITKVVEAAMSAAEDKIFEIRKAKIYAAGHPLSK